MSVKVDREVLAATAVALDGLAGDVPGLLSRATALDARYALAGLTGAEQWAADTGRDLRARIGIIDAAEGASPTFAGISMSHEQALAIAGQEMSVDAAVLAAQQADAGQDAWATQDPANLDEWFEQMQARAVDKLTGLDDAGLSTALVNAYSEVQGFIHAGQGTVAGVVALVRTGGPALAHWLAQRQLPTVLTWVAARNPSAANWLASAVDAAESYYLRSRVQFRAPNTFVPNLTQGLLLRTAGIVEDFDGWVARLAAQTQRFAAPGQAPAPTRLAQLLQSARGQQVTSWVSRTLATTDAGALLTRAATLGNNVFGRPWTNPVTGQVFVRGGGNLVTIARTSGVGTMARTAGALRMLGVVGSGVATVDGVVGLVNNHDEHREAWASGDAGQRAGVVADYAEVGFNASMTAALICPNPVTWGAVAVTGVVWAGASVVEHWDDIERGVGEAAEWVGDRASDAADWVGDRLDDVKESPVNPMNWF